MRAADAALVNGRFELPPPVLRAGRVREPIGGSVLAREERRTAASVHAATAETPGRSSTRR